MKTGFFTSLVAAGVLALGAAAQAADTIKIGINVPLNGFAAADGKSALTGAKLAVQQDPIGERQGRDQRQEDRARRL